MESLCMASLINEVYDTLTRYCIQYRLSVARQQLESPDILFQSNLHVVIYNSRWHVLIRLLLFLHFQPQQCILICSYMSHIIYISWLISEMDHGRVYSLILGRMMTITPSDFRWVQSSATCQTLICTIIALPNYTVWLHKTHLLGAHRLAAHWPFVLI